MENEQGAIIIFAIIVDPDNVPQQCIVQENTPGVPRKKIYHCSYCNYSANQSFTIREHERKHTGERPYHCSLCPSAFRYSSNLKRHIKLHEEDRGYNCPFCSFSCAKMGNLEKHIVIHPDQEKYKCNRCFFISSDRILYVEHYKCHNSRPDKEDLICNICGKEFSKSRFLRRHKNTVHGGDKNKINCKFYPFTSSRNDVVVQHMKNHTLVKKYKCTECSFSCSHSGHFGEHMKLHKNDMSSRKRKREEDSVSPPYTVPFLHLMNQGYINIPCVNKNLFRRDLEGIDLDEIMEKYFF